MVGGVLASWLAFLLWGECIARGNGLITRNFLYYTSADIFDSAGISYHNTKQQSLPFTCLSFVCFCFLIVFSIVEL